MGPTYHPETQCGLQLFRTSGGSYTITLVSGGASGVASKLKTPLRASCVDKREVKRAGRRRLSVSTACERILSQRCSGKLGFVVARPERRRFLKVYIARSAVLVL